MKKILFLLLCLPLFLQAQFTSDLVVFNPTGEPFTLSVNNSPINTYPQNKVLVADLQAGYYNIGITFTSPQGRIMLSQQILIPSNALVSIKLVKSGSGYIMNVSNLLYYNALNYNPDNPAIHPVPPTPQPQNNTQQNTLPPQNNTQPQVSQNVIHTSGYCSAPMSEAQFQQALASIQAKSFESDKLTIAKQIASTNCLLSGQVKRIMHTFDFEATKLSFAKFAYTHTYDVNNYYVVNEEFEFSSSIQALQRYINSLK